MDILNEARTLIEGDRQDAYGDPLRMWEKIASAWSVIFGFDITPEQAILAMCQVKLIRQSIRHRTDNIVDLAGYALLLQQLSDEDI